MRSLKRHWCEVRMGKNKEDWAIARERTGRCETCGAPMKGHPKCEACGILTGHGHQYNHANFRGRVICGGCIVRWLSLEHKLDREVSWERMLAENWREMFGGWEKGKPGSRTSARERRVPCGAVKKGGIDCLAITDPAGRFVARRGNRQQNGGNVKQRNEGDYSLYI